MAKLSIAKGATSVLVRVFIQDSSSTTGAGLASLAYNTSGLTCYQMRDDDGNAGATAVALATATLGTWTSKGFKEKDATNAPGWYEFGIPNAALATGSRSVDFHFKGATNMAPVALEIELTAVDNQSTGFGLVDASANVVQWSGTNVSSPATAGIPEVNVKNINNVSAASVTTVKAVQGLTTADTIATYTGNTVQTGDAYARLGAPAGASTAADIAAIKTLVTTLSQPIRTGTAQAGAGTSVTLDAGASATNSFYNNDLVLLTGGTGAGQARFITAYVGSTKVATVATWATNPDNTSTFAILPFDAVAGATAPTVAQIATGVWQDTTSGDFTTSGSIGKSLFTSGNAPGAASGIALVGSNMGTVTTCTNLTNAPTSGDFTSTMKTSIGTAVAASAVASVTGNVGGNVTGSVGSVTGMTDQTGDVYALLTSTSQTELTAVPASTATLVSMLKWLFLLSRNKLTQTGTTQLVKANDGSTTVGTSTDSDDGTTAVRGAFS